MSENSNDDMGLGGLGNADFLAGLGDLSKDMPKSNSDDSSKSSDNPMLEKASEARVHMANSMMAKNKSSNDAETDRETSEAFSTDNDDTSNSTSDEDSTNNSDSSDNGDNQSSKNSRVSNSSEASSESNEESNNVGSEDSDEVSESSSSSNNDDSGSNPVDNSDNQSNENNSTISSSDNNDKSSASQKQSDKPQNSAQSHATKEFKALLKSKEASEERQKASNAQKIIANNDVTPDGQNKPKTPKQVASLAENTAQKNLKNHTLPQAAMEDLDSPQVQLNKAKGAHNEVTSLLKKARKNDNHLNDTEFAKLIMYSNQSFNDLYGSMVKDRQQSKYRLDSLEKRIKNMTTKASEGSSALATLKEEGTFAGVSQDIDMLSKIMDDPRIQEFTKQKHLNDVALPKPLAQENKKAKDVDYERDQAKQKAEKSSN